jgi:hypothetical protein
MLTVVRSSREFCVPVYQNFSTGKVIIPFFFSTIGIDENCTQGGFDRTVSAIDISGMTFVS